MLHRLTFILFLLLSSSGAFAGDAPDLDDRTRAVATDLRCVVCQNLSVADSPSEMAQQMRDIVREQLRAGKTPQEIKDFFVSKYGEWVLLAPATTGFSLTVWVVPFVVLIGGLALGLVFLRRWSRKKNAPPSKDLDSAMLARVRSEASMVEAPLDPEDSSELALLRQERARQYADLKELEFDFQAGKLSESDYTELRRDTELKAAAVLEQLDRLARSAPPPSKAAERAQRPLAASPTEASTKGRLPGWQITLGGILLVLFGVTLGVLLTKSSRPRESGQDTITGDFLTGTDSTGSGNSEVAATLKEGKAAFEKQDFAKAIESFKKVLAADPNQPEAHAYMGLILIQAGHADGALMAFDKALAVAPNFPMALWGKGMTLYQGKQDPAGAAVVLEKLLKLMPPGNERNEVEKVLAEIHQPGRGPSQPSQPAQAASPPGDARAQVSGVLTIDPKFKATVNNQAALFIIARSAGGAGGPPLAVKKIDRPAFPLSYTLGSENVMMQGRPLTGKIAITVRLDKDGNPTTRTAGDLSGDYKKNPVQVGSKNVDIVLDQIAR